MSALDVPLPFTRVGEVTRLRWLTPKLGRWFRRVTSALLSGRSCLPHEGLSLTSGVQLGICLSLSIPQTLQRCVPQLARVSTDDCVVFQLPRQLTPTEVVVMTPTIGDADVDWRYRTLVPREEQKLPRLPTKGLLIAGELGWRNPGQLPPEENSFATYAQ
jgi:hypothetical protein